MRRLVAEWAVSTAVGGEVLARVSTERVLSWVIVALALLTVYNTIQGERRGREMDAFIETAKPIARQVRARAEELVDLDAEDG